MPTIVLPERKPRPDYKREYKSKRTNEIHSAVYNTQTWRELRLWYLMQHPLCEVCLDNENVVSATEVHHKHEISNGSTLIDKKTIGFDSKNLMSLCKQCHIDIHKIKRYD